jgi:hypothetical protein
MSAEEEEEEELESPETPQANADAGDSDANQDSYVPIQVSSDTAEEPHSDVAVRVDQSDHSLGERFERFVKEKHDVRIEIEMSRIDLAPPMLRQPLTNIVTKIKRWAARNPSGPALTSLQDLADRLNDLLELQLHREDHDYELRCRDLLRVIYQNTLETQRVTRQLKDASIPRALDEYD